MANKIHFVTNVQEGFPALIEEYNVSFSDNVPQSKRFPLDLSG
jgi:hypothetical protein